jgi:hypothetical protein
MPMQAESLEVLEQASVAPAQSRAIVRAIEIEIAGAKDTLATKSDIADVRAEMRQVAAELRAEMRQFAAELRAEMAELRAELRGEMAELRAELRGELGELRGELGELHAELRAEIQRAVSGVTRQMYMAILGQMAVLLGFAYFFATHLR